MLLIPLILSIAGLAGSGYMYFITMQVQKNPMYKAACDFSDAASCTKPIKSKYAKMIGVPNALVALAFYAVIFFLALFDQTNLILILSAVATLISIYLAYILFTQIKSTCVLCITGYIINILLLLSVIGR